MIGGLRSYGAVMTVDWPASDRSPRAGACAAVLENCIEFTGLADCVNVDV